MGNLISQKTDFYPSARLDPSSRMLSLALYNATKSGERLIPGTEAKACTASWEEVCIQMGKRKYHEEKFAVPAFSPVLLSTPKRKNENVLTISMLVLDIDHSCTFEEFKRMNSQYEFFAYSTHSNMPHSPKFRAIFPIVRDVAAHDWPRVYQAAVSQLANGLADVSCKDKSRLYFFPSCPRDNAEFAFAIRNEGIWLNPDELLASVSSTVTHLQHVTAYSIADTPPRQTFDLGSNLGTGKIDLDAEISEGSRNDGLTRVAGHFARGGLFGVDLFERVQTHNIAKCKPSLDRDEVRTICESVSKRESAARATAVLTFEAALLQLNEQFAWIQTPPAIWRIDAKEFIPVAAFRIDQGNRQFLMGKTHVELGTAWLKWEKRRQHPRLAFEPQKSRVMPDGALNLWEGFAVLPAAGDASPWVNLMTHLFPHAESRLWIQQWLAHSIQHPGTKKHSAIVCWSREQGLGKNLVFEAVAKLFGRHAAVAQPGQLGKQFNAWMRDKLLIISDETGKHGNQQTADLIKTWITSSEIVTEQKNQPSVALRNVTDFIFLGNNADAVHLSAEDRRFSIFEIKCQRLPDAVYRDFARWRDSPVGLPALLHYLKTLDLTGFDPKGHAPMTNSKRAMIDASRSPSVSAWRIAR